jgi:hypothetical protein
MTNSDFAAYANALIAAGHDRDWVRRNEPLLRRRFTIDRNPFPPPPPSEPRQRDRYAELD